MYTKKKTTPKKARPKTNWPDIYMCIAFLPYLVLVTYVLMWEGQCVFKMNFILFTLADVDVYWYCILTYI